MMQPTTLRGIFPDRPVVHRRNFIRENVKRIKQMQGETHDMRAKSDSNGKFATKMHLTTSLSKLKLQDDNTPRQMNAMAMAAAKQQARRPGIQKLEIRPAERRQPHISDLMVVNNISHRSMQTEAAEDMVQIYATGVIKYPTNSAGSPQRKRNLRRRDPGNGDSPDVNGSSPLMKQSSSSPGDANGRTDFIKNNVLALKTRPIRKATHNNDPTKVPSHYKKGVTPKYIKNAKKELEEDVVDLDCPPGHVLLPEEERKETLRVLRESYAEKIQEMNSMPVRSDTLKMQKRKMDLEIELKKIDEGIKVFQRPKVYVKLASIATRTQNGSDVPPSNSPPTCRKSSNAPDAMGRHQEDVDQDNGSKLKKFIQKRVRIVSWLPQYSRMYFLSDLVAGITVGLTLMPQSIAYASIAELPPHVGLYTALMGSFAYIFFGTIKQVSIGPSSILSLLTYTYLHGRGMDYVILLTFLSGIMEFIMGVLNLGIIVDFISSPVTSAFTSATALVIIIAQFKNIFGIRFHNNGVFDMLIKLFTHIKYMRVADTALGVCSMLLLIAMKRISLIKFRNPRLNKAVWLLGICRNAITVIIGSFVAFAFEQRTGEQPFKIAGQVTPGLPAFALPPFSTTHANATVPFTEMLSTLGSGILVVPVVAILANVAIAKKFSDGTVFDATQEMIALGVSNILGSFVGSMPTTGAFTRSAVNEASHVQTPMGGLYAGTMVLLALSYLTPCFYYIPKSTIAAVLICAVIFMVEYQELPKLWRNNKFDFWIGLSTFVFSLYFGVEIGLAIGCCLNLLKLMQFWARPRIFSEVRSCGKDNEYLFIRPELGFYYPAAGYFRQEVLKIAARNIEIPIVLDLQTVINIDYSACVSIKEIVGVFKESRKLILLNIDPEVRRRLKSMINLDELDIRDDIADGCISVLPPDAKILNEVEIPLIEYNNELRNNEANRKSSWYDNNVHKNNADANM